MLKIRHGMLIGLIAVIAAVAYANNSDNQQAPLGVVTKAEQKQPPTETPGSRGHCTGNPTGNAWKPGDSCSDPGTAD